VKPGRKYHRERQGGYRPKNLSIIKKMVAERLRKQPLIAGKGSEIYSFRHPGRNQIRMGGGVESCEKT